LLQLVVAQGCEQAEQFPRGLPAAEMPLFTYAAAGEVGPSPVPLAGCCLCLYLGADVLDNVLDRELSERWAGYGSGQAILAGVTLLTPLASATLAELDVSPQVRLTLQDALVETLLTMSAGQSDDTSFEGHDDVTLAACETMVLAKSGAELSFFARAGAVLAGASPEVCEAYAVFGRELGATIQITSDCADLGDQVSRDLATGKRTLPVVYGLSTMSALDRGELLGHLGAAPHDPDRNRAACRLLRRAGALHFGALAAEVHRQRALSALHSAHPSGPSARALYDLVGDLTIVGRSRGPAR
jgi:geranylgeranyl diphosphate synthase, type I